MFWRKSEPKIEFHYDSQEVPTSTLLRWYLYDVGVESPNQIATAIGYTAVSAEGEEMERRESMERLCAVQPYKSFIELFSGITGEVMSHTLSSMMDEPDTDDEELTAEKRELVAEVYARVAQLTLIPAFSAALQLGLMVNPGTYTGDIDEF